jgi:hypothetical protein
MIGAYLLLFRSELFVFLSAVQKCKNYVKQDYNFAFSSVWVQNLVFDVKGGTQTEGA